MLASLLFPYDDGEDGNVRTSGADVERWLSELEREGCIIRYQDEGAAYVQVANWLIHQKIDKPSKSKIPAPPDNSRSLANPLEPSATDLGPRTKDLGREGTTTGASAPEAGGGGDDSRETGNHASAPLPARQDLPAPTTPALSLTLALRPLGVSALSTHPTVIAWADAGVSLEVLTEAVQLARETKGAATLSPNYLAPIVERLLNPPPGARPSGRTPPPGSVAGEKFAVAGLDHSSSRAAMDASMKRHGIVVPEGDEEISFS